MLSRTFRIVGQVIDRATKRGAAGVRVEAWDKDGRFHDLLGIQNTDTQGRFVLRFEEAFFHSDPPAPLPDVPVAPAAPDILVAPPPPDVRVAPPPPDVPIAAPPPDVPIIAPLPRVPIRVPLGAPLPFAVLEAASPETFPDLFFKVFLGETLIANTENDIRWNATVGDTPILIEIDAPPEVPLATSTSSEVGLHELGGSIAAAAASVQQELARYQSALGAFVLDNIDIDVPVRMRMDEYGQLMTTVTDAQKADAAVGRVSLRVKPVLGASQPPPVNPGRPLESLGVLTPAAIQELQARRIFSVDDLARVATSGGGRSALGRVELGAPLDAVLDRATVLKIPQIPEAISEKLVEIGVTGPADFVKYDPSVIATSLTTKTDQPISRVAVESWQREVREQLRIPLPTGAGDAVR